MSPLNNILLAQVNRENTEIEESNPPRRSESAVIADDPQVSSPVIHESKIKIKLKTDNKKNKEYIQKSSTVIQVMDHGDTEMSEEPSPSLTKQNSTESDSTESSDQTQELEDTNNNNTMECKNKNISMLNIILQSHSTSSDKEKTPPKEAKTQEKMNAESAPPKKANIFQNIKNNIKLSVSKIRSNRSNSRRLKKSPRKKSLKIEDDQRIEESNIRSGPASVASTSKDSKDEGEDEAADDDEEDGKINSMMQSVDKKVEAWLDQIEVKDPSNLNEKPPEQIAKSRKDKLKETLSKLSIKKSLGKKEKNLGSASSTQSLIDEVVDLNNKRSKENRNEEVIAIGKDNIGPSTAAEVSNHQKFEDNIEQKTEIGEETQRQVVKDKPKVKSRKRIKNPPSDPRIQPQEADSVRSDDNAKIAAETVVTNNIDIIEERKDQGNRNLDVEQPKREEDKSTEVVAKSDDINHEDDGKLAILTGIHQTSDSYLNDEELKESREIRPKSNNVNIEGEGKLATVTDIHQRSDSYLNDEELKEEQKSRKIQPKSNNVNIEGEGSPATVTDIQQGSDSHLNDEELKEELKSREIRPNNVNIEDEGKPAITEEIKHQVSHLRLNDKQPKVEEELTETRPKSNIYIENALKSPTETCTTNSIAVIESKNLRVSDSDLDNGEPNLEETRPKSNIYIDDALKSSTETGTTNSIAIIEANNLRVSGSYLDNGESNLKETAPKSKILKSKSSKIPILRQNSHQKHVAKSIGQSKSESQIPIKKKSNLKRHSVGGKSGNLKNIGVKGENGNNSEEVVVSKAESEDFNSSMVQEVQIIEAESKKTEFQISFTPDDPQDQVVKEVEIDANNSENVINRTELSRIITQSEKFEYVDDKIAEDFDSQDKKKLRRQSKIDETIKIETDENLTSTPNDPPDIIQSPISDDDSKQFMTPEIIEDEAPDEESDVFLPSSRRFSLIHMKKSSIDSTASSRQMSYTKSLDNDSDSSVSESNVEELLDISSDEESYGEFENLDEDDVSDTEDNKLQKSNTTKANDRFYDKYIEDTCESEEEDKFEESIQEEGDDEGKIEVEIKQLSELDTMEVRFKLRMEEIVITNKTSILILIKFIPSFNSLGIYLKVI